MPPGRQLPGVARSGDDGAPHPRLLAATHAYDRDPGHLPEVLAALHTARVLVPVVAGLGETEAGPAGLTVEKSSDISLPVLVDGDGSRAVPVFSGVAAMARWDASARPVPVQGPRAAAVALAEGASALVLDVAGPVAVALDEPELRALVGGRGTVPAYDDEDLAHSLLELLTTREDVLGAWISPWPGADARLTVAVRPGRSLTGMARLVADPLREAARRAGSVRGIDLVLQSRAEPQPAGRALELRAHS